MITRTHREVMNTNSGEHRVTIQIVKWWIQTVVNTVIIQIVKNTQWSDEYKQCRTHREVMYSFLHLLHFVVIASLCAFFTICIPSIFFVPFSLYVFHHFCLCPLHYMHSFISLSAFFTISIPSFFCVCLRVRQTSLNVFHHFCLCLLHYMYTIISLSAFLNTNSEEHTEKCYI